MDSLREGLHSRGVQIGSVDFLLKTLYTSFCTHLSERERESEREIEIERVQNTQSHCFHQEKLQGGD